MALLNIEKLSLSCKDREKEEQKQILRRRTLLILIHHYLEDYGFIQTADVLKSELNFPVSDYAVCDNIHLEAVLQDFESYNFLKYQKLPQIVKKIPEDKRNQTDIVKTRNQRPRNGARMTFSLNKHMLEMAESKKEGNIFKDKSSCMETYPKVKGKNFNTLSEVGETLYPNAHETFENYSSDWKSMAHLIMQDVGNHGRFIHWDDIIGHERAKEILKEAIVYPLKYGDLFSSVLSSWKGILLYGPTGTGKTLLATAAACESQATLFKICTSTILSKWRGESEKLVKVLFDLAKHYAPSVIFIDEIDSLLCHRGNDHEASKRMKTEFFLQMDSLFSFNKFVLVLGATNMPWELDYALLRRMEKRILISLPDVESRILLFKKFLRPQAVVNICAIGKDLNYEQLAKATDNYSAADIELVCKEAKMNSMRQVIQILENNHKGEMQPQTVDIKPLQTVDVLQAICKTKPAASEILAKYTEWKNQNGSE